MTKLFGVKKLTCFAIKDVKRVDSEEDDCDFITKFFAFSNQVDSRGESIEEYKYAQDQMFRPCVIHKYFVVNNTKQRKTEKEKRQEKIRLGI